MRLIRRRNLFALGIAISLSLAMSASAHAGTITVSTTLDELDGAPEATCSLREAVQTANTDVDNGGCTDTNNVGDADTIVLSAGEYDVMRAGADNTNVGGDLDSTEDLTIQGGGSASTGT